MFINLIKKLLRIKRPTPRPITKTQAEFSEMAKVLIGEEPQPLIFDQLSTYKEEIGAIERRYYIKEYKI